MVVSVSVECAKLPRRVVRHAYPGTVELDDVKKVTREWLVNIYRASVQLRVVLVVLAGGFP